MKTYDESDIDGVLKYMTIFHPEKANREYCNALLEYWEMTLKHIAINNPDNIGIILEKFEASKQKD
ncbi:MAG: hypothetical protein AAB459_04105 [Patescibacteria group bacterium]|jgi:hypothetical protein